MLVDLHAHFPMHVVDEQRRTHERVRVWCRRRWQGRVVDLISRVVNYQGPGGTPSVTEQLMRDGDVGITLSVLYQPFDEMDLTQDYAAPPRESYFEDIVAQHQAVEHYVRDHCGDLAVAHSVRELDELLHRGVPILIHAIEGGFQLGRDPGEIRRNVAQLARLGVAYVTLAHLFLRQVATNAPALPFLPDWLYNRAFRQPREEGLTPIGREVVEAMVDEGILIDLTHMRRQSMRAVLDQLDARDPSKQVPVIATHMAYRFGGLEYCFDDEAILAVAARGGVIGCIVCKHYMTSGLPEREPTLDGSVDVVCRHIDKIHELTGSYDNIAIGSDLDGYIKPALPGLEHMGRMGELQKRLHDCYGAADAEKICSGNALRVLRAQWGHRRPRQSAPN